MPPPHEDGYEDEVAAAVDEATHNNLAALASLLRRQHSVHVLTLRMQLPPRPPASAPAATTAPAAEHLPPPAAEPMEESAASPMKASSSTRSTARQWPPFPPLATIMPTLPHLHTLHIQTAPFAKACPLALTAFRLPAASPFMPATAHLLGALLPHAPRLHTLNVHRRELLDDAGLEEVARCLERQPVPALHTVLLEPPRCGQGKELARFLLSGPFHRLKCLTVRRVNALGMVSLQRFLTETQAPRLEKLVLFRDEIQLAYGDSLAEALAQPDVAPRLRVLKAAFLPFSADGAEVLVKRRLAQPTSSSSCHGCQPLRELHLWAAGLRFSDLCTLLLPSTTTTTTTTHDAPPALALEVSLPLLPPPQHHLHDLRVLCLNFHCGGVGSTLLPAALAAGACPRLEELSMVHCKLDDSFARTLAAVLANGSSSSSTGGEAAAAAAWIGESGAAAAAAPCGTTLRRLDLAYNGLGLAGLHALLAYVALSSGCSLRTLRLDGNPALGGQPEGGVHALGLLAETLLSQPHASLRRLERLELRRIQFGTSQAPVLRLVAALLQPGKAPSLCALALGVERTRGMNAEGGREGEGYVPAGTAAAAQVLAVQGRRPALHVSCEAASAFLGLVTGAESSVGV